MDRMANQLKTKKASHPVYYGGIRRGTKGGPTGQKEVQKVDIYTTMKGPENPDRCSQNTEGGVRVKKVQADPVCGWLLFLAYNSGPVGKAPVVPTGPLGSSSSQHGRTPELVL